LKLKKKSTCETRARISGGEIAYTTTRPAVITQYVLTGYIMFR